MLYTGILHFFLPYMTTSKLTYAHVLCQLEVRDFFEVLVSIDDAH